MSGAAMATLSLHPEHLVDLQRSGLSDDTIDSLGIHSARPGDIPKLVGFNPPGVMSALVFPYPGEDGFSRIKVFPSYTTKDGHTCRYLQRPGSCVRLYVPPVAEKVLADPTVPLALTEGEKKSAKACQEGLPCVGLGGLWNWTQDGHPIPELSKIAYADREMIIYPDSDVWIRLDLMKPVYAVGKELEGRGAKVTVAIIPPGPNGKKRGLDDYLVDAERAGIPAPDALAQLKRLSLKHATFNQTAEWWKIWQGARVKNEKATDAAGSGPVVLADPEPWPEPVDGAAILEEIEITLTRFVILPRGTAAAIALWVLHACALAAFDVSPYLAVVSATMRCGKTTVLSLLSGLLPRALPVANITPAALFRCIEQFTPSLLIDEGDTFLAMSDELRGLLNAGHTRTAGVVRTVGEEFEPRIFKVFCPKVLAMIGKPPGTIEDRSIVIPMKRKTSGEPVQRYRLKQLEELAPLSQKAARWAHNHVEELKDADPAVPESLNDRAADNWRPLLAIADLVGGDWPHRARTAALMLSGGERDPEADGAGVMLIADCVAIFNDRGIDRLSTTDLIAELVKLEERPWPEWSKGKHITPRVLARLLKPFGIKPKVERAGNAQFRGYEAHAFDDAHPRYFQGSNVYHPYQSNENNNLDPNFKVYQTPDGTHTKSDLSIEKQMDGTHGTHKNPENGRNEHDEQDFDVTTPGFETHCAADLGDLFDSEEVLL